MRIRYGSVCSGVEAASIAWVPLGWEPMFFAEVEPFPCHVLHHRFGASGPLNPLDPEEAASEKDRKLRRAWKAAVADMPLTGRVPNLGDMTKINGEDWNGKIDCLVGGTPCFTAGAQVLTPTGYVPIESLHPGDMVISHTGDCRAVLATGNKTAKVGRAKILGRPEIKTTADHPFYSVAVKTDYRRKAETYANKIAIDDYAFVPIAESVGRYAGRVAVKRMCAAFPSNVYNASEEDIAELAGWYVGDGYIRRWRGKNKKAVIIAAVSPKKVASFRDRFFGKISYYEGKDGKLQISNTELAEWLILNFGELSYRKRIPYWLYSSPLKAAFIGGYEKTDGHAMPDGNRMAINTTSAALAYGVADLYGTASVLLHKVSPTTVIEGRTVSQRDYYNVSFHSGETPRTRLFFGRHSSLIRYFKEEDKDETVYNITVEREHSYIVNGLAVHNCQSLSLAGNREGLEGVSGLALKYIDLLRTIKPKWFVWENVPGALSSNKGEDFKRLAREMSDCGYSIAWRVLDCQHVRVDGFPGAVPQQRRRLFVVGHLGADWQYPATVLFEPESQGRDIAPGKRAREGVAHAVTASLGGVSGKEQGTTFIRGDNLPLNPLCAVEYGFGQEDRSPTLTCNHEAPLCFNWSRSPARDMPVMEDISPTMMASRCAEPAVMQAVCYENHAQDSRIREFGDISPTIPAQAGTGGNNLPLIGETVVDSGVYRHMVRRLTPLETERLQGFPDNWTRIPMKISAKPPKADFETFRDLYEQCPDGNWVRYASDSPRYKACGNSMPVNVMRWIGIRIEMIEEGLINTKGEEVSWLCN